MRFFSDFHVALTFLTRLGRARVVSDEAIRRSMGMHPLVGALLGAIYALLTCIPCHSWVLAWMLVGFNMIITRGLHWDGWADVWDGWGSGARGARFWEIVKDSRVGAFGVMGLVLGLSLQAVLLERVVVEQAWATALFAPVLGRFCCLVVAWLGRSCSRPGLGRNAMHGAVASALCFGGGVTLCCGLLLPAFQALFSICLCALPVVGLLWFGRLQGGVNGDFLGTAIIAGEFCALLPVAVLGG